MVSVELPLRSHFPLRLGSSSSSGGTPAHACAQCAVAVAGDGWNSGALGLPGLPIGPRLRGLDEFCRFAIAKTEGNIGKLISFYPLLLVVFFFLLLKSEQIS